MPGLAAIEAERVLDAVFSFLGGEVALRACVCVQDFFAGRSIAVLEDTDVLDERPMIAKSANLLKPTRRGNMMRDWSIASVTSGKICKYW